MPKSLLSSLASTPTKRASKNARKSSTPKSILKAKAVGLSTPTIADTAPPVSPPSPPTVRNSATNGAGWSPSSSNSGSGADLSSPELPSISLRATSRDDTSPTTSVDLSPHDDSVEESAPPAPAAPPVPTSQYEAALAAQAAVEAKRQAHSKATLEVANQRLGNDFCYSYFCDSLFAPTDTGRQFKRRHDIWDKAVVF